METNIGTLSITKSEAVLNIQAFTAQIGSSYTGAANAITGSGLLAANVSAGRLLWRNADNKLEQYDFTKDPAGIAGLTLTGGLANTIIEYIIAGEINDSILNGEDGVLYIQSDGTINTSVPSSGYYWIAGSRKNNIVLFSINQDNIYIF